MGYLECDFPRVAGSNENISPQPTGKAGPRPQLKAYLFAKSSFFLSLSLFLSVRWFLHLTPDYWRVCELAICFDFVFPELSEKCKVSLCLITKWEGKCGGSFQGTPLFNSQAALIRDYTCTQTRVHAATLIVTHWKIMSMSRSFFRHDECFPYLQLNTSDLNHGVVGGERPSFFHLPKIVPNIRYLTALNSVPEDRLTCLRAFWLIY